MHRPCPLHVECRTHVTLHPPVYESFEHTPHSGPPIPAEHIVAVVESAIVIDDVVVGCGGAGVVDDDVLGAAVVDDDVVGVVGSEQFAPVYPR